MLLTYCSILFMLAGYWAKLFNLILHNFTWNTTLIACTAPSSTACTRHFTLGLQQIIIVYMLHQTSLPDKILTIAISLLHHMWNALYLAVLKMHLSPCAVWLDMDMSCNKSWIPWELEELSPTQRSEMDGSHCTSLLQFIRQTVNMLGIVWAIISIWDSFKVRVPYLLSAIARAQKVKQKLLQFKYLIPQYNTYKYTHSI